MKSSNEKISDALNIEFTPEETTSIVKPVPEKESTDLTGDFNSARSNISSLIDTGMTALDGILKVATESDSPRAYEVLSNMIKTLSEMNKDLMDIHEKMSNTESKKITVKNTTNNSIYVGSTSDLQNLINRERSPLKVFEEEDKEWRSGYLGNTNLKPEGQRIEFTKEQVEEYVRCAQDPSYFVSKYIKVVSLDKGLVAFDMYPYQKKMIEMIHNNRFVIAKLPRQSGKTTTVILIYYTIFYLIRVLILPFWQTNNLLQEKFLPV